MPVFSDAVPRVFRLRRLLATLALCLCFGLAHSSNFDKAEETALAIQDDRRSTQAKIEQIDDQTQTLLGRYRVAYKQVTALEAENARMDEQVAAQLEEIASLEAQLAGIEDTQRKIYPQMDAMLTWLDSLAEQDLPFLLEERQQRLGILSDLLDDPDARLAEQLGRLLEAYRIELDFGRTLEAWRGALPRGQDGRVVELLRVGRIGLFYLGLDGDQAGRWDADAQTWVVLDQSHIPSVQHGLRLARKQVAPSLLTLPLPVPGATDRRLSAQVGDATQ
jgi:hypothetical protein